MRLTDDMLCGIVRDASGGAAAAAGAVAPAGGGGCGERRLSRRVALGASAWVIRHGSFCASPWQVAVEDISAAGVGLVMGDAVFAPGEQIVLRLSDPAEPERRRRKKKSADTIDQVLCTVRAVRVRGDGRTRVGAEFAAANRPAAAHYVAAVRSTVAGSAGVAAGEAPDRASLWDRAPVRPRAGGSPAARGSDRMTVRAPAVLQVCLDDGTDGAAEQVEVVDYSDRGVGVVRAAPLAPGAQFVVRFAQQDEQPVVRLCAVTRAEAVRDRWLVGARFIPFARRRGRGWVSRLGNWLF